MASNTSKKLTLATPLQYLKGIGPARAAAFARKDVLTLGDALYYFPRRYEDRRRLCQPRDLGGLPEGIQVTVLARIQRQREIPMRGRRMFELIVMGENGDLLTCTWFQVYKGMKERFQEGKWAIFQGALKKFRGSPQIVHPEVEILEEKPSAHTITAPKSLHWGRVVPIYSRSEKLSQKFIREILNLCLETGLPLAEELLPDEILRQHNFPPIAEALREMHFPQELPPLEAHATAELPRAVQRLIFEEFFKFQLVMLMDETGQKAEPAAPIRPKGGLARKLRQNLPYTLTNAQERAIKEALEDLGKPEAMNRIVQGDVGSGKTNVAMITAAEAIENGFQVALMAPTEILAEQHYKNALALFKDTDVKVELLLGALSKSEKGAAQDRIASGEAQFVIGTHALIQESVKWKNLGFVIVDEQHRFGVKQRTALKEKTPADRFPHILTMTATPIPRSLALTIFGRLAVSTIDELPPGRQEIQTRVIPGADRQKLYNLIHREAKAGRQTYLVYPLVADSEKEGMEKVKSAEAEYARLADGPLHGLRIALVHGQMKSDDRARIMREFKEHKHDVLISTTVIEVGVDVPNATLMAVENAERFGLSQLHQLRGRVGRGEHKSFCVLVTDARPPLANPVLGDVNLENGVEDESPWVRLRVLEETRDGFKISAHDLKLRGPGDFFGTKQSGSPTFRLADLERDQKLLEAARMAAQDLFKRDPKLMLPENKSLAAWFSRIVDSAAAALKSG